ncbi:heavy metal translocating P-type ATPase [Flavisolibacter ginsenosidimutans]|uniref:HAD-IC family P-type ATPase n=1 Tax=Flavisolibacter ginsenosidimutans TaxID=661481 RepID=A0A5B8UDQ5_9BACT|nr:heavy metal translocating P-type ATPase metal-binding domain-containing protein [Flavisolibacter ginsenosidimutans]QEC54807.1 HAD-IC family P-type ATPase [Flavisolibacter ginsenosidimutans]
MPAVDAPVRKKEKPVIRPAHCYHCGEVCDAYIAGDEHVFCCDGCKFVYSLLKENGLCNYYDLSNTPGIKVKGKFSSDKFSFLDTEEAKQKLITFKDEKQSQVGFYLPQMHCASCIWLLENLHAIQQGILFSKTNFGRKEVFIAFNHNETSLRKVVELLAFIGYEPYISLNDSEAKKEKKINRKQFYKIGVAGFCFSNIMMLSFPEYFSSGDIAEGTLKHLFVYLNLVLALPVFFYSASDFFVSAWKGLQQKWLNIDAPIALSILITFSRSVYEVLSGTGAGYFDSMSGIVLFMLAGRWFQNKTYDSFSFDRDYKSYFPLGITKLNDGKEVPATIGSLEKNDRILVRHGEMVPADSVLLNGEASIDYSFVSGENTPLAKNKGELIYAGAKQLGGSIELLVIKPVNQSYITQLWNNNDFFADSKNGEKSFVHPWSRYFTAVLFTVAALAGVYWSVVNPANVLPAVSAALIVACPCSLLLSATFTFGNMLRYYGKNGLYLKNATVIESLARVNKIVFDKTGTLTYASTAQIEFAGSLTQEQKEFVYSLAKESAHPLSRLIKDHLLKNDKPVAHPVSLFTETPGKGAEGLVNGYRIKLGSRSFITGAKDRSGTTAEVWVAIEGDVKGCFSIQNLYREGVNGLVKALEEKGYGLHLLSGDNDAEKGRLQSFFGRTTPMLFNQSPQDKLDYIKGLKQTAANKVLMLGDGLNDAGALKQSNVGIAISENTSQFTPASDAILDSKKLDKLNAFLGYAKAGKTVVLASWVISILYNFVGLGFAVQAKLSPLVAAILMPVSSITIVTFVTIATTIAAKRRGL